MTTATASALFVAMALLAAVPSLSVLTVSARAAALGFAHGAATALGIVVADLLFVLLAVFGLALLVGTLGGLFFLIQSLGGAWLLWLGLRLWRGHPRGTEASTRNDPPGDTGYGASFIAGLALTLADQKAVLFYLGFLPAFVDLTRLSAGDVGAIAAITVVAVGGVKLGYAALAATVGHGVGTRATLTLNRVAAGVMIAVGALLLVTAARH